MKIIKLGGTSCVLDSLILEYINNDKLCANLFYIVSELVSEETATNKEPETYYEKQKFKHNVVKFIADITPIYIVNRKISGEEIKTGNGIVKIPSDEYCSPNPIGKNPDFIHQSVLGVYQRQDNPSNRSKHWKPQPTRPQQSDCPQIFLWSDKIEEEAKKYDIDFSLLLIFVMLHELMHAVMDVHRWVGKNGEDKGMSDNEYRLREECMANALALRILKSANKDIKPLKKYVEEQSFEYALGGLYYEICDECVDVWLTQKLRNNPLNGSLEYDQWLEAVKQLANSDGTLNPSKSSNSAIEKLKCLEKNMLIQWSTGIEKRLHNHVPQKATSHEDDSDGIVFEPPTKIRITLEYLAKVKNESLLNYYGISTPSGKVDMNNTRWNNPENLSLEYLNLPMNTNLRALVCKYVLSGGTIDLNWLGVASIHNFSGVLARSTFNGNISEWEINENADCSYMFAFSEFNKWRNLPKTLRDELINPQRGIDTTGIFHGCKGEQKFYQEIEKERKNHQINH